MEKNRISYHETVLKAYERIKKDNMDSIWDRYEAQGMEGNPDQRCPFCESGMRCDLCSNGPCRVDVQKNKRGVCGITGDGMAMRMMLLKNILGASTYHYHTEQTIRTLRAVAMERSPFKIKDPDKLMGLAIRFNLPDFMPEDEIILTLCNHFEADFQRRYDEPSHIVLTLAPKERIDRWKELGIFPGGIYSEMLVATSSCLTNVDGDYRSLAKKALRLSIAMAYQSQLINEYCQDILFGIPRPHKIRCDLGVLDPDYVNVLPNGHEPFIGFAMVELARKKEWQEKAKSVGAKGLRIIGNIETGQEMIQRMETDEVFYGYTGNWLMQEAILASGCVDLFACDMNCSMPIDPIYAEKYKFKLIPVSELVAFEGINERVNYKPEEAEKQAAKLLEMAIENFKDRRETIEPITGLPLKEALVGFSTESIFGLLGGTIDPLLKAIIGGTIRGIAALVSCTTLRDSGQDFHTIAITKELIKRDVLVISMGCGNAALQVAGLCNIEAKEFAGNGLKAMCELLKIPPVLSFGTCTDVGRISELIASLANLMGDIPVYELPVVAVVPEYMEQKATIDAIFTIAYGLYTYVNPQPTITGATNLLKFLTEDLENITGGKLNFEKDPVKAVENMVSHIEMKRKKLGIQ